MIDRLSSSQAAEEGPIFLPKAPPEKLKRCPKGVHLVQCNRISTWMTLYI
jgi:hypothetical protein